ncbi:MAG: hypothetical protein AAGD07_07555 [Planctomycetota bacterium]
MAKILAAVYIRAKSRQKSMRVHRASPALVRAIEEKLADLSVDASKASNIERHRPPETDLSELKDASHRVDEAIRSHLEKHPGGDDAA